jgi:hypothetical protein
MKTVAFLVALCGLASALPQDAPRSTRPGTETAPATRPAPRANDPAALALFRKAAADQTPGDPQFELKDFQADLVATLYEKGQEGKSKPRTADITEFWRAPAKGDGGRYRRDLFEPQEGKQTTHGYDGTIYWERLGKGAPRELVPREDHETLRRLREEVRRMNDLASSILLRKLDVPEATWSKVVDVKTLKTPDGERAAEAVRREVPGRRAEEFYFGSKAFPDGVDRTVLLAFKRPKTESASEEILVFDVHQMVGEGRSRILAPLKVETYDNGALILRGAARSPNHLKFNVGLEDRLFAPLRR